MFVITLKCPQRIQNLTSDIYDSSHVTNLCLTSFVLEHTTLAPTAHDEQRFYSAKSFINHSGHELVSNKLEDNCYCRKNTKSW